MSDQDTYLEYMDRGLEGALSNTQNRHICSKACGDTIYPGRAVSYGPNDDQAILGKAAPIGIAVRDPAIPGDASGLVEYAPSTVIPVLESGPVLVRVGNTGNRFDPISYCKRNGCIFIGGPGAADFELNGYVNEDVTEPDTLAEIVLNGPPAVGFTNRYSLEFLGIDEYVDFLNPPSLRFINNFSVSAWIKIEDNGELTILSKGDRGAAKTVSWYLQSKGSKIKVILSADGDDGGVIKRYVINQILSQGIWYQVGFDFASDVLRLYLNGDEQTPVKKKDDTVNALYDSADSLIMGAQRKDAGFERYYDGKLDEVSLWRRTLSAPEWASIYNGGSPGNLSQHSAYSDLISWYSFTREDVVDFPTINDYGNPATGGGTNVGDAVNMVVDAINTDTP